MNAMEECFRKNMLKSSVPDMGKAGSSLKIALRKLDDAKMHYENNMYDWAFIAAYTSMFHSARALLFRDGVKERSHYCLCVYIKEKYRGRIEAKYLAELDTLREQRHSVIYGDENVHMKEVEETEAQSAIKISEGFLQAVKKLIEQK